MNFMLKSLSAIALGLSAVAAFAAPKSLVTHNLTNQESNAFVANTPSPYPTAANKTSQVAWNFVILACYGHSQNNICAAEVKMATDTANPILVGTVKMDLKTGDITPKIISANGYTLTVNGPGEATITKN